MTQHDESVYLRHMRDYAQTAIKLTVGKSKQDLTDDPMFRYAMLHLVCIVGEAANRVSAETRKKYTQIPWRNITGMRNILIHGYETVETKILWGTISVNLPKLADALTAILEVTGEG